MNQQELKSKETIRKDMRYRPLGRTAEEVSVIGLGGHHIGRQKDEKDSIPIIRAAIDAGINFIDVSPYYGLTKAENVLGKALKRISRDRYILATKCGRYGANIEDFDFSAARVTMRWISASGFARSFCSRRSPYIEPLAPEIPTTIFNIHSLPAGLF